MIVYLATKTDFPTEILPNRTVEKILDSPQGALCKSVGESEVAAWRNPLPYKDRVLDDQDIPDDTGVAIEFNIPQTGKRIDMILTGTNHNRRRTAVIGELKQRQQAAATTRDATVSTVVSDREDSPKVWH